MLSPSTSQLSVMWNPSPFSEEIDVIYQNKNTLFSFVPSRMYQGSDFAINFFLLNFYVSMAKFHSCFFDDRRFVSIWSDKTVFVWFTVWLKQFHLYSDNRLWRNGVLHSYQSARIPMVMKKIRVFNRQKLFNIVLNIFSLLK